MRGEFATADAGNRGCSDKEVVRVEGGKAQVEFLDSPVARNQGLFGVFSSALVLLIFKARAAHTTRSCRVVDVGSVVAAID